MEIEPEIGYTEQWDPSQRLTPEGDPARDPDLSDWVGMVASGAMAVTGAIFGLKSFTGVEGLFNALGKDSSRPRAAAQRMLGTLSDRMRGRDTTSLGHLRAASARQGPEAADEEALENARRHVQMRQQARSASAAMVEARTQATVRRMQTSARREAGRQERSRLNNALRDQFGDELEFIESRPNVDVARGHRLFEEGILDYSAVRSLRYSDVELVGSDLVSVFGGEERSLRALQERNFAGAGDPVDTPSNQAAARRAFERYRAQNQQSPLPLHTSSAQVGAASLMDPGMSRLYSEELRRTPGETPSSVTPAQIPQASGATSPRFLFNDPFRSAGASPMGAQVTGRQRVPTSGSRADELAGELQTRLSDISSDIPGVELGIQKRRRGRFQEWVLSMSQGGQAEEVVIPEPDEMGQVLTPDSNRPRTVSGARGMASDLFRSRGASEAEGGLVERPHEAALRQVLARSSKIGQDLTEAFGAGGERSFGRAASQVRRVVRTSFEKAAPTTAAPGSALVKANTIHSGAAQIFNELRKNPSYRQSIEGGLASMSRLQRAFNRGANVLSIDSEYVSLGESFSVGLKPGSESWSKMPYEVAGRVSSFGGMMSDTQALLRDADQATSELFEFRYVPRVEGAAEAARQMRAMRPGEDSPIQAMNGLTEDQASVFERARQFQLHSAEKGTDEIGELFSQMESGEISVSEGGRDYHFSFEDGVWRELGTDGPLGHRAPEWAPQLRAASTSSGVAQQYSRFQSAMLQAHEVSYSVAHNAQSSEVQLARYLAQAAGDEVPQALRPENFIDTYQGAQVASPNRRGSLSLGRLHGLALGFTDGEEYQGFTRQVRDLLDNMSAEGEDLGGFFAGRFMEEQDLVPQGDSIGLMGDSPESRRDLLRRSKKGRFFLEVMNQANSGGHHAAGFDAAINQVVAADLDKMFRSGEGKEIWNMYSDALDMSRRPAGIRNFLQKWDTTEFGRFDIEGGRASWSGGLSPFHVGQTAAMENSGVEVSGRGEVNTPDDQHMGFHPRLLTFAALQNPMRQLYQRFKARPLTDARTAPRLRGGNEAPVSAAFRETEERLTSQIRGREKAMSPTYIPGVGIRQVRSEAVQGYLIATERERQFYEQVGQGRMGRGLGVSAVGVSLPQRHHQVMESQAQQTAALNEALRSEEPLTSRMDVDIRALEGEGGVHGQNLSDWLEANVGPVDGTEETGRRRYHAEQMYLLKELQATGGGTDRGNQIIEASVENHRRALAGEYGTEDPSTAQTREALTEHRSGKQKWMERRMLLFEAQDPSARNLRSRSRDRVAPVSMTIERSETSSRYGTATLMQIPDSGPVMKAFYDKQGKNVSFYNYPGQTVGMGGELFAAEAAFSKTSRKELAGLVRGQIGRNLRRVNNQLRYYYDQWQAGLIEEDDFLEHKARLQGNIEDSIGKLSGTDLSGKLVDSRLGGGGGFDDAFALTFGDEITKDIEYATTASGFLDAAQIAGNTVGAELRHAEAMGVSAERAAGLLAEETEAAARGMQIGLEEDELSDPNRAGSLTESQIQETELTIKRLRDNAQSIRDAIANGHLHDMHHDALQQGTLVEVYRQRGGEEGAISAGLRGVQSIENMQALATGGTEPGTEFDAQTGRAVKGSQTNSLSAAILGRSMGVNSGVGPMSGVSGASSLFQAYMGAESVTAALSGRQMRSQIAEALMQRGQTEDGRDLASEARRIMRGEKTNYEIQYDTASGEVKYYPDGEDSEPIRLRIAPFAAINRQARARSAMMAAMRGTWESEVPRAATTGEALTVRLDGGVGEGEISGEDFDRLFGARERAARARAAREGISLPEARRLSQGVSGTSVSQFNFMDDERVADVGQELGANIFSGRYSALQVDLRGGVETERLRGIAETLRGGGGPEDETSRLISRALGGPDMARRALDAEADTELDRARLRAAMDEMGEGGFARSLIMTLPHAREITGRATSMSSIAELTEGLQAIRSVGESVREIERMAERLGESPTKRELDNFRSEVASMVFEGQSGAEFSRAEQMYASSFRKLTREVARTMRDSSKTLFGGQFKVAGPQQALHTNMSRFAEAYQSGDLEGELRRSLLERNSYLSRSEVDRRVGEVSGELEGYIGRQVDQYGADVWKWQGFGAGEGFLGRSQLEGVVEDMEGRMGAYESGAKVPDLEGDPTSLRESARRETLRARREMGMLDDGSVQGPGSTMGIGVMSGREPLYAARGGAQYRRITPFSDDLMRAMGMSPGEVHYSVSPLDTELQRADFDADLTFMIGLRDPAVAARMRRDQGMNTARQIMGEYRSLKIMTGDWPSSSMTSDGYNPAEGETERIARQGSADLFQRITAGEPMTGEEFQRVVFPNAATGRQTESFAGSRNAADDGVTGMFNLFSRAGQALREQTSGPDAARRDYAMIKAVSGPLGAIAKRSAVMEAQAGTAFTDIVSRLKMETVGGQNGLDRLLSNMTNPGARAGGLVLPTGGEQAVRAGSVKEYVNRIFNEVSTEEGQRLLFKGAEARGQIAEEASFGSKYSTSGLEKSQRLVSLFNELRNPTGMGQEEAMRQIMGMTTMQGDGGGIGFRDQFAELLDDDLLREEMNTQGRSQAAHRQLDELARRSLRLSAGVNQIMGMFERAGIQNSYDAFTANRDAGSLDPASRVMMSRYQQMGGMSMSEEMNFSNAQGLDPSMINEATITAGPPRQVGDVIGESLQMGQRAERAFATWTESWNAKSSFGAQRTLGDIFDGLPFSARKAGLAGAAVLGAAAFLGGSDLESPRARRERYETGTRWSTGRAMQLKHRRQQEQAWLARREAPVGVYV